ncbi:MAG: SEC59/DGK1/VTE5 family protein [Candidatus Nanoarchaeia archaeon]
MGERLQRIKAKWKEKREEYKLELKRQFVHALGVIFVIPIILFPETIAIKIFGVSAVLVAFGHWYFSARRQRHKHFKEFIRNLRLKREKEKTLLAGEKKLQKFESLLLSALKAHLMRKKESPLLSSFYFLLSSIFALLLFGASFAIIGLITLGIGDSASTIVGKKFGRTRLLYNKDKSIEGSFAFFIATFIALLTFFYFFPQYALINKYLLAIFAAFFGALIETIPTANDNATIPVGVSACLWLVLLLL